MCTGYMQICMCAQSLSRVGLFMTLWAVVAHQAPVSMEFSRQEYWSRLPFPTPGNFPDPGIETASPSLTLVGKLFTTVSLGKPYMQI